MIAQRVFDKFTLKFFYSNFLYLVSRVYSSHNDLTLTKFKVLSYLTFFIFCKLVNEFWMNLLVVNVITSLDNTIHYSRILFMIYLNNCIFGKLEASQSCTRVTISKDTAFSSFPIWKNAYLSMCLDSCVEFLRLRKLLMDDWSH